ncbi:MAG: hypothetical protein GF346_00850 [Candidatus Eisenbacteria bacterium]|nr:hypothetical protein [Candidatus Latescibacterota bacterium]MBD3300980.1 hypothetical protein [Candidatus Eisenbacteria bacterium]
MESETGPGENTLPGLRWVPRRVSRVGCLEGCLAYHGMEAPGAWVHGGTGHAFALNVHASLCPSGPTAWDMRPTHRLERNLGVDARFVFADRGRGDLVRARRDAWDLIRSAIDDGIPCYAWELAIPEYAVVYGYDGEELLFSGPGSGDEGRTRWDALGESGIGIVEAAAVRRGSPARDHAVLAGAVAFAWDHAAASADPASGPYRSGPAGFDLWRRAVEQRRAIEIGMAYNAAVWAECRAQAAAFLEEAGRRLPELVEGALAEATRAYRTVAEALGEVARAYPFRPDLTRREIPADARIEPAARALAEAGEAEATGLQALRRLRERLTAER